MNRLPDALIIKVLDHLHVDELINKKVVCKRWKKLIENDLIVDEIIIRDEYEESNSYYFTFEPIKLKNTIYSPRLDYLNYSSFRTTFIQLKKLKTNFRRNIDLEQLNHFQNLTHLEIDDCLYLDQNVTLNLKNLTVLKVFIFFKNHKLIVNSLNLKIISCFKFQIEVLKPQMVEYIEVKKNLTECFKRFCNLKVFKCVSIENLKMDVLYRLPIGLKKLHLYTDNRSLQNHMICKEIIMTILSQKWLLQRNLIVYFQGVLLDDLAINLDEFREKDLLKLIYDNYDDNLENDLSWYTDIDYNELMLIFENHLPASFFTKFNNIQLVSTCGVISKKEFTWFIGNCPSLRFLFIKNSCLDQEFFTNLSTTCSLLMNFYLQENERFKLLNYEFTLKFELLKEFKVSSYLPWCFVRTILKKLKFIHYLSFIMNKKSNSIKKLNGNKYKFRHDDQIWSNLDQSELIELIDELEQNG